LWEKPSLAQARSLWESGCLWYTFVTIGSGDAFLELLAATVPHLLYAIGNDASDSGVERLYRRIEPMDFSKHVLSSAPECLLVLSDGPSGWTDFGSPHRAAAVLHTLASS
jgi:hypothetical protein